jgi:hypothetical protein
MFAAGMKLLLLELKDGNVAQDPVWSNELPTTSLSCTKGSSAASPLMRTAIWISIPTVPAVSIDAIEDGDGLRPVFDLRVRRADLVALLVDTAWRLPLLAPEFVEHRLMQGVVAFAAET